MLRHVGLSRNHDDSVFHNSKFTYYNNYSAKRVLLCLYSTNGYHLCIILLIILDRDQIFEMKLNPMLLVNYELYSGSRIKCETLMKRIV